MKEQTPVSPQIQAASSISADAVAFRALPKNNLYSESLQHFPIQRKLSVGAVDDPLEHEADAMADRVMRMPDPSFIQRKCAQCEDEEAQRKPLNSFIQKKGTEGKNTASNAVYNQIQSTKGGGTSMPEATKSFMESRFETDFSNVRIHSGEYASQLSNELDAQAFTVGSDIYFNSGKFSTESSEGKRLLAHELTHTLQQKNALTSIQRVPAGMLTPYTAHVLPGHASILDTASSKGKKLIEIPQDYEVQVLSNVAGTDWLNVQATFNGTTYTGFTHRTNVSRTQNFTNTTDTGNAYTSQLTFENSRILISKRVNLINGGGFISPKKFTTMKERFVHAISNFLSSKFSIEISSAGKGKKPGDGIYPIDVKVIEDTSGPYSITFMGNVHGRSQAASGGATFYELGQVTENLLPEITFGHEGSHLVLGGSDEYANPGMPGRTTYTDNSLLGDFYTEGVSKAKIKHRHFAFIIPTIQSWFPGKTITLKP